MKNISRLVAAGWLMMPLHTSAQATPGIVRVTIQTEIGNIELACQRRPNVY